MICSWWMDTLGQLIGPLALKFLNTLLNLSNFPNAPCTQVAPLKIPILKIKSRITGEIMTQCLCPEHIHVWSLERDASRKGMLIQSRGGGLWGSPGKQTSLSSQKICPFSWRCINRAFHFRIPACQQCISCLQVFIFSMQIYMEEILFDLELCFAKSKLVLEKRY